MGLFSVLLVIYALGCAATLFLTPSPTTAKYVLSWPVRAAREVWLRSKR